MLPHAGSRCRQYDDATAEVFATSLSFRKPKFAAVCPTAVNTGSRELHSVVNTDAGKRHGFRGSGGGDRNTATTRQEDRGRQEQETGTYQEQDRHCDTRNTRNRTGTAIPGTVPGTGQALQSADIPGTGQALQSANALFHGRRSGTVVKQGKMDGVRESECVKTARDACSCEKEWLWRA